MKNYHVVSIALLLGLIAGCSVPANAARYVCVEKTYKPTYPTETESARIAYVSLTQNKDVIIFQWEGYQNLFFKHSEENRFYEVGNGDYIIIYNNPNSFTIAALDYGAECSKV